jgi:hypothetical protein
MTWKFHILAITQQRLLSRILQILESQMVDIHSFSGETTNKDVRIEFVFSSEHDKAYRIQALLYRLEGIRNVSESVVELKGRTPTPHPPEKDFDLPFL